jgi:hypothetical protein
MIGIPQIITKMYDFLLYLIPQVSKFPRSQRYLVGERLEISSFHVLELLLEAAHSRNKAALLQQANIDLEKTRYYARLCKDLKLVNVHGYEIISRMINEIGVQLGGWLKQQRAAV